MAINLDAMKAKLDKLNGKGDGKKNFWRPEDGESNIRIVSTKDGDPFKEKFFHYGVGGQSFLCPKRNFGDDCPTCNFANKLWNEGTEDSKKQAKEMFAKQRFFSPVLVRGEEAEGIRVWGYGKMAYEKLLTIVLDPDYAVGGDDRCAELLETIPNFDEIFERKTTEEVRSIMDQFLSGDTGNTEVEKFGGKTNAVPASSDAVENAFNDLLSQ